MPMKRFFKKLRCLVRGHDCIPTGRHALLLTEHVCEHCGDLYVSHAHHGNTLIRQDVDGENIMENCMEMLRKGQS